MSGLLRKRSKRDAPGGSSPDAGERGPDAENPDVMREADALVRAGRRLEAIELLTAANRRERRDEIERRLVKLRNEAFADLDPAAGLESWPPSAPELFPDASGLPEIAATDLGSDALRSGILRHGGLIVRGLLAPVRVAQLVEDIDRTFRAQDEFFDGAAHADTAPWFVPFQCDTEFPVGPTRRWVRGGGGVLTVESPRALFDVLDAFAEVGLAECLAEYLGERPVLAAKKFTLRRVPLEQTADWHQDGAFLGHGIRAVNVWVALSHCGDDAPGLDVVARRMPEIAPTGTEGAWFDWSVGRPVVERVARGRADRAAGVRGGRRVAVRRDVVAPHRDRAGDDPRAVRARVVVLRTVALPARSDPHSLLRPATSRPGPEFQSVRPVYFAWVARYDSCEWGTWRRLRRRGRRRAPVRSS